MNDELKVLAARMAAQLQGFADDAREAGSPMIGIESLVKEFDEYERVNCDWRESLMSSTDSPGCSIDFGDEDETLVYSSKN